MKVHCLLVVMAGLAPAGWSQARTVSCADLKQLRTPELIITSASPVNPGLYGKATRVVPATIRVAVGHGPSMVCTESHGTKVESRTCSRRSMTANSAPGPAVTAPRTGPCG